MGLFACEVIGVVAPAIWRCFRSQGLTGVTSEGLAASSQSCAVLGFVPTGYVIRRGSAPKNESTSAPTSRFDLYRGRCTLCSGHSQGKRRIEPEQDKTL